MKSERKLKHLSDDRCDEHRNLFKFGDDDQSIYKKNFNKGGKKIGKKI